MSWVLSTLNCSLAIQQSSEGVGGATGCATGNTGVTCLITCTNTALLIRSQPSRCILTSPNCYRENQMRSH